MAMRTSTTTKNGVTIELFNDKETRQILIEAEKMVGKAMAKAVAVGATTVVNAARKRVPVDTGQLARSITYELQQQGPKQVTAIVGPTKDLLYGMYLEYGTGIYAVSGMGRKTAWSYFYKKINRWVTTVGMKPKPYLFPALQSSIKRIQALIAGAIKEDIDGFTVGIKGSK